MNAETGERDSAATCATSTVAAGEGDPEANADGIFNREGFFAIGVEGLAEDASCATLLAIRVFSLELLDVEELRANAAGMLSFETGFGVAASATSTVVSTVVVVATDTASATAVVVSAVSDTCDVTLVDEE
jgi:hypothetical protein